MRESSEITKALALIDEGLSTFVDRQLVSASEVTDLLLDVRAVLAGLEQDSPWAPARA